MKLLLINRLGDARRADSKWKPQQADFVNFNVGFLRFQFNRFDLDTGRFELGLKRRQFLVQFLLKSVFRLDRLLEICLGIRSAGRAPSPLR